MRLNILVVLAVFFITTISFGQESNAGWTKLNFLIGNWIGEGSGNPGEGTGYSSFKLDLDKKILIRNSHSEYPATKDKPLIVHNDLMIIYLNNSGNPAKAIYFDNEGHVINYSISIPNDKDIVFTSDKAANTPIFRLTYSKVDNNLLDIKFEMSQDGTNYITYVKGKSKRRE